VELHCKLFLIKAEFIYENLMIQTNLINAAKKNKIKNLIFFGSSCIYPKYSKQPIKEEYLLNGKLEEI
jgi:GDP-L-fucose synthase